MLTRDGAVRVLRWAGLGLTGLVIGGLMFLVVTGVPRPPSITQEGLGRVGWSPLLNNLGEARRGLTSRSLGIWLPNDRGLTASVPRRLVDFRLHTIAGPGAEPRFVSALPRNAQGFNTGPGRPYVVYSSDEGGNEQYRLYRWDPESSETVLLTPAARERARLGAFEPNGPRMAFTSMRRTGSDADVYVMDPLRPGSERKILEREGSWAVVDWSPTDEELLLVRIISTVEKEVYRYHLETGALTRISDADEGPTNFGSVQYSKDGRGIFYSSDRRTEFRHLRRLDLASGTEMILSGEIPWDVTSIQQSGDGTVLVVAVNEDGRTRYYVHEIETGATSPLDLPLSGIYGVLLHPERKLLRVNHLDPTGVTRGYVYDMDSGELTLWIGPEPQDAGVPEARLVRFPTFDSDAGGPESISAFVYPGAGEGPRPVLIEIHGGPESQSRLTTSFHLAQSLGVTVIAPNVRGSTGYGKTFTNLDNGYRREDSVRDIGALLDWISLQPDMDSGRVMVSGASYGGYMVLASLVHFGDRLRCGVDIVGISHFVTFLENTADYRRNARRAEYGDEQDPRMRAFLDSISPLNRADRIQSRLMIIQGANDPRVPASESRQFVERLQANGTRVAYIEADNEGHGFTNPWNSLYSGFAQMEMTLECLMGSDGS